jgi:glycerophosphoryl diester phosphodiesterase
MNTGFRSLTAPILLGHRGACLEHVENTLPAFEAALALGVDAIETDLHVCRDGTPVLSHDPDGARLAGDARAISTCSFDEVACWQLKDAACAATARVASLEDALVRFPSACWNIDVKVHDERALPAVLAAIARHRAEPRVLLTSFSSRVTRALRALRYSGPIGLAQSEAIAAVFMPAMLLERVRPGFLRPDARLQIPTHSAGIPLARRGLIDKLRTLSLPIDYWVINDPDEAEALLALGAQGIVTDDVRAMAALFERSRYTSAWRERHGR